MVSYKVITRDDDRVAQRHETIGTKRIYEELESKNVHIRKHAHDNNASIMKYVRENHTQTINQLDNWHALKQLEKSLKTIAQGPRRTKGIQWHPELEDKPHAVRTHAYYCLMNCNADADKLKAMLLNFVQHYKGVHTDCAIMSRCCRQENYEPRHQRLQDEVSIRLLTKAVEDSVINKKANLFIYNMSTAHVESFNNSLNVVHDNRITFGMQAYKMRTALAVGYCNNSKDVFTKAAWKCFVEQLNK